MGSSVYLFVVFFAVFSPHRASSFNMSLVFDMNSLLNITGISPALIQSITTGTQMAIDQCQKQFKWDKWNCPEQAFSRDSVELTREQAYISAIKASGIVHSITKSCSRGELKNCKCHSKPQNLLAKLDKLEVEYLGNVRANASDDVDWTWGGCSDDVTYGTHLFKSIFTEEEGLQRATEMHNFKIGREITRETIVKKCRCHGVSGSCSLQTCWIQVAPFHVIASKLKEKYGKAVIVKPEDVEKADSAQLKNNLVYMEQSPNYCLVNSTIGWSGTKARSCSRSLDKDVSISEKKSCRHLCRSCGLRVRKKVRKVVKKCKCAFAWCCEVKCQMCEESITEYVCE